jgi:hypothetical protein
MSAAQNFLALLALGVSGLPPLACGEDPCSHKNTGHGWYPIGESEFLPRSEHVPAEYDSGTSEICSRSVGPGGLSVVRTISDGSLAVVGASRTGFTVARESGKAWAVDEFQTEDVTGPSGNESDEIADVDLAVGAGGYLAVAWMQNWIDTPFLRGFDGSSWVTLGNGAAGVAPGGARLALDGALRPVVAWRSGTGPTGSVYLARLNGSAWEGLDGSASGTGISGTLAPGKPRVVISGRDIVDVVWEADGLFVTRFENTWQAMGGSMTGSGIGSSHSALPVLAVTSPGTPVVAFRDIQSAREVLVVTRWTGQDWEALPAIDTAGPNLLSLAVDRSDNPVIAYQVWGDSDPLHPPGEVFVLRFDGTEWVGVNGSDHGGGVTNSANPALSLSVVATTDRICVAWSEAEPEYDPIDPDDNGGYAKGGEPRLLVRCSSY